MEKKGIAARIIESDAVFSVLKVFVTIFLALLVGFLILAGCEEEAGVRDDINRPPETSLGSKRGIGETLLSTTPLIFSGLGFALAYRCKLFNIGLEGQIAVGGLVAAFLGYSIQGLPAIIHLPICILGAALAGGGGALFPQDGRLRHTRGHLRHHDEPHRV